MKGRVAGESFPGDGGYDRGVASAFSQLAKARQEELGVKGPDLVGRIIVALAELGQPPKYDKRQLSRVLNGEAGAHHLQTPVVEAWCRALEITDPLDKATWYAAAGHKPAGVSLEQYRRAFRPLEAVAS